MNTFMIITELTWESKISYLSLIKTEDGHFISYEKFVESFVQTNPFLTCLEIKRIKWRWRKFMVNLFKNVILINESWFLLKLDKIHKKALILRNQLHANNTKSMLLSHLIAFLRNFGMFKVKTIEFIFRFKIDWVKMFKPVILHFVDSGEKTNLREPFTMETLPK